MKRLITLFLSVFVVSLVFHFTTLNTNTKETEVMLESVSMEKEEYIEVLFVHDDVDSFEIIRNKMQNEILELDTEDRKEWFLAYKEIIFKYEKWFDVPETVYDVFSADEVRLICQLVETECYDQEFMSKVNVANVVFNRFDSGRFGDTITEIVTAPYQFAYGRKKLTEETILAVMYAFEMEDTTNGALFFHSMDKTDTFCGNDYMFTDDAGHNFY